MNEDAPGWPAEFAERYRAAGYWRGETFSGMLAERAGAHPERVAVVAGERRLTYAGLHASAERMAGGLYARGIRPGDRVVVQLPNLAEFAEICFALFRLGALPVFALPAHRMAEIGYLCGFTEAAAYVTVDRHAGFDHRELAEAAGIAQVFVAGDPGPYAALAELHADGPPPVPGPKPGDLAFLQLSGGTTGLPKLIPRTHDDYLYSFRASAEICGLGPDSVYLAALPAAHNFPMSSPGIFGTLYAGGRVVMSRLPSPDVAFPLIEAERVTITALVPPLALLWMSAAERTRHDLGSLELLQVGGARLADEAARRVRPSLGCALQQVFGMAEGLLNYTRLDDPEEVVCTTQGRPLSPADEVRLVDERDRDVPDGEPGSLITRGPYTPRGYFRAPEQNARSFTADGWYRSGDACRRTPEGNLVVEGRDKDMINRGGEKISAEEVENLVYQKVPGVSEVAAVAMPDRELGERVCVYVVPRADATVTLEAVRSAMAAAGVARFKLPEHLVLVDELPITKVGKIDKKALRADVAARPQGAAR